MRNIKLFFILLLVASVSLGVLVSCASKKSASAKISEEMVDIGDMDVPDFYINPPLSDTTLYGVGSAKMKQLDASRRNALARARNDIAFQINVQVQASMVDYYQESGTVDTTQALTFAESISRQISDTTLSGARTEEIAVSDDGTVYALVSYPTENILASAEEAFIRNESAAFAEFKAQEALKRLDAQLENNPTRAGQSEE